MKFTFAPLFEQEGAIGAASSAPDTTPAPPSVEAGVETPDAGNAPAAAPAATLEAPNVTQQESFAARLKEQTEKIRGEYEPHVTRSTRIETIAKLAGMTVDQYLDAVEVAEQRQAEAQRAQQMGVDDETYRQHIAPVLEQLDKANQESEKLRIADAERQVRADYERLKSQYPDFVGVQDAVFDLAEKRNLPLEDAFKLISFDARLAEAKNEGQAAAVAAIRTNAASSTGAAGGDAPNQQFDFTKLPREERQQYYEKAKRGELKSLH